MNFIKEIPDIAQLLKGSNYIDIKTIEGQTSLRHFIAAMLSYYPRWIIFLYHIRGVLVKLLGLYRHPAPEAIPQLTPEDVSFVKGEAVTFFTVRTAKEKFYWIGETPEDKHLSAYFCVAAEPLGDHRKRFHVATIVYYKHWTGPVYFNLIRPFHHLVVARMMRAGVQQV
ncbi:MAG: DUF2867 domain-containing protein [Desulfobacterales bacterium]|jgi:hypothetical protein